MKKMIVGLCLWMIVVSMVGCTQDEKRIVIASKPMTEQYIIVEMLTYLVEANTDITVEQKLGIGGGTSNIHPAMINGEIDIYPEYTGTGWLLVLEEELINDPNELYLAVKDKYKREYGITWSELYGFNDTFGIAVNEDLANELELNSYSDLAKVSNKLNFGAEYDFFEREDGYPGLEMNYGFEFADKTELDIGLKYEAIGKNQVDAINIFSTDGRLKEYGLKVLEDDKNFFPSYYCATLIRDETLEKYPELEDVISMLDNQITNDEMTQLNYLVEIEKKDPKQVALDFLEEKGLK
jgi:glycine betaine/choline ABC-type transport system substrate-binding protein